MTSHETRPDWRHDSDPAQARSRDDWQPHVGRHHYATCGEYRPVQGNRDCPRCPPRCPGCGTFYVTPKPVDPAQ